MSALEIWRLCPERRAATAFAGEGSRLAGGRWSQRGVRVVYCAASRSLAAMEVLANIQSTHLLLAQPWVTLAVVVPDGLVDRAQRVPGSWQNIPYTAETQAFGSDWARENRSVALRVPSAVVLGEFNYLLNPAHPQFAEVRIGRPEPFAFDTRFKR